MRKPTKLIAGIGAMALAATVLLWMTRAASPVSANSAPLGPRPSFLSQWTVRPAAMLTLPPGTRVRVRLNGAVTTEKNVTGDLFATSLDEPLIVNGKTLAPRGSTAIGLLTDVSNADRGATGLTMVLRQLEVGGNTYDLVTQPLTLVSAVAIGGVRARRSVLPPLSEPVSYGPDTRFTFTLADSLDLPVAAP